MKTITESFTGSSPDLKTFNAYFNGRSFAVFDIETTGLSSFRDSVILAGALVSKDDELRLIQYFAEDPLDEEDIIRSTAGLLNSVDLIITYNGKFFDIPFMEKRAKNYGIPFPRLYDLDLYVLFKHYSDFPKVLNNISQKSMEEYAGISGMREDRISGGDSVNLYNQFYENHSAELERLILLHNCDDVKQLYRLLSLLRNIDIHRALHKNGFPVNGGLVKNVAIKHNDIMVKGLMDNPIDYIKFPTLDEPFSLSITGSSGEFKLTIPCEKDGKYIYFDAANILQDHMISLEKYPGFASGFLIAKEVDSINYGEINFFLMEFLPIIFNLIRE